MIFYFNFYKRFGLRIPQQLMTPVVANIDKFEFPRNSIYHFVSHDNIHFGPENDDYLFRLITKPIYLNHITEISDNKGMPKKIALQIIPIIRDYHASHRRYRFLRQEISTITDENTLIVSNYGFALKGYKYIRSMYSEYYKWWNIEKTVWDQVDKDATNSSRQNYVFMKLPKILPSVGSLNLFSNTFNQQLIKILNSNEKLGLLELWKWLNPSTRSTSTMAGLSEDNFNKVNIVYQDNSNWTVFNLGILNSWIKREDSNQKVKIEPEQLQRRFLRMLMSLMAKRAEVVEVGTDAELEASIANGDVNPVVNVPLTTEEDIDKELVAGDSSSGEISDQLLAELETDLKQLQIIEQRHLVETEEVATPVTEVVEFADKRINHSDFEKELDAQESMLTLVNSLAEDGLMSASEFKRLSTLSSNYKQIESPYNPNETLEQAAIIAPESLAIESSAELKDFPTVLDKSMNKTSLLNFDERYIKNILPKDTLSMVVNMQKAGVAITEYNVDKVTDILGDFETHTVRVKPIEGVSSTLRFTVPTISEDGRYSKNGSTYSLRKQRVDMPIRKVSPELVALTSYYGKSFIQRSQKKVNNYQSWLVSQIMMKGLDDTDICVTEMSSANVFDNEFPSCRTYSILAQSFKSFKSGKYNFLFDHKQREKDFTHAEITKYENNGMVIIGRTDYQEVLVIDKEDTIYTIIKDVPEVIGTMESILNLNSLKAPVEFSEVKIFGKYIPVGIVLGYQLGLGELMNLLKVSPRRVATGQRVNLTEDEYSLIFSDETLIFSKDDKLASMILSGFNEFYKTLKGYSSATFNKPNVYWNVLEANDINARYLREIDLMTQLFIDPITRSLLVEMKEPTTFRGLLVRSSELLLNDQHPDLLDMKYMRIRGYERISGAVYNELVQAIRVQRSKGSRKNSMVSLHPFAVWKRISTDPSIAMVSDINPLENLKEMEAVTFAGVGGRSGRSMVKSTRAYHPSDMGLISEATKDSSDVAINVYTSADPHFKSLRGTTYPYKREDGVTSLISTSALMAVGSDKDD